jgi:adenine/guanine/hypoxanthine permease
MRSHIGEIPWNDGSVAIPAFLTMISIPLTFSIANGLAFGFTSYALMRIVRGQFRKADRLVYPLAALFVARLFTCVRNSRWRPHPHSD